MMAGWGRKRRAERGVGERGERVRREKTTRDTGSLRLSPLHGRLSAWMVCFTLQLASTGAERHARARARQMLGDLVTPTRSK